MFVAQRSHKCRSSFCTATSFTLPGAQYQAFLAGSLAGLFRVTNRGLIESRRQPTSHRPNHVSIVHHFVAMLARHLTPLLGDTHGVSWASSSSSHGASHGELNGACGGAICAFTNSSSSAASGTRHAGSLLCLAMEGYIGAVCQLNNSCLSSSSNRTSKQD